MKLYTGQQIAWNVYSRFNTTENERSIVCYTFCFICVKRNTVNENQGNFSFLRRLMLILVRYVKSFCWDAVQSRFLQTLKLSAKNVHSNVAQNLNFASNHQERKKNANYEMCTTEIYSSIDVFTKKIERMKKWKKSPNVEHFRIWILQMLNWSIYCLLSSIGNQKTTNCGSHSMQRHQKWMSKARLRWARSVARQMLQSVPGKSKW